MEALRGIRGVYAEYSWGIHGIFICIGYVSGMYRVCIGNVLKGTGREGGGMPTTDEHGLAWKPGDIMNDNLDNLRPNQYPLGAKREICQPLNCTELHGNKGDKKSKLSKLKTTWAKGKKGGGGRVIKKSPPMSENISGD